MIALLCNSDHSSSQKVYSLYLPLLWDALTIDFISTPHAVISSIAFCVRTAPRPVSNVWQCYVLNGEYKVLQYLVERDEAPKHFFQHWTINSPHQYGQVWFLSFQRPPSDFRGVSSEIRGSVNLIHRFLGFLMHRKFKLCLCNNTQRPWMVIWEGKNVAANYTNMTISALCKVI